jgi:hypothetical protein
MKRPASTKVNTQGGELSRLGQARLLVYVGDEACQETGQRVRLRPKWTKETPLLSMVGLRPLMVSGPASFAKCATTTSMN